MKFFNFIKISNIVKSIKYFIFLILLFFISKQLKDTFFLYKTQDSVLNKINEGKKFKNKGDEYADFIIDCLDQSNFANNYNIEQKFKDLLVLKYNLKFFDEDCIDITEVIAIEKLKKSINTINKLSSETFVANCNDNVIKELEESIENFIETIGAVCSAKLKMEIFDKLWIYIFKRQMLLEVEQHKNNSPKIVYKKVTDLDIKLKKIFSLLNKESIKEAKKFKLFRGSLFQLIELIKNGIIILDNKNNDDYLNDSKYCIHKHILYQYKSWKEYYRKLHEIYCSFDMDYVYFLLLKPLVKELDNNFEELLVIYQKADDFIANVSFKGGKLSNIFSGFKQKKNKYKSFILAYKDLKYNIYGYDKDNSSSNNKLKLFYFKEQTYQLYLAKVSDWLISNDVKKELYNINDLFACAYTNRSFDDLVNKLIIYLKENRIKDLDPELEDSWISRLSNTWKSLIEKRIIANFCISNQLIDKPLSCNIIKNIDDIRKDLDDTINHNSKNNKMIENFVMTYLLTSKYEKFIEKDISCNSISIEADHICSNNFIRNLLLRAVYTKFFKLCLVNNSNDFNNIKDEVILKLRYIYQNFYQNSCLDLKELEKTLDKLFIELKQLINIKNKSYLSLAIKDLIDSSDFDFKDKSLFNKTELFKYTKFEYLVYMYLKNNNISNDLVRLKKASVTTEELIENYKTDLLSTMNNDYLSSKYFEVFFESLKKALDIYCTINLETLIVEFGEYIQNDDTNSNIIYKLQNCLFSLFQPIDYNNFIPIYILDEICIPIEYMLTINNAYKIANLKKDIDIDWIFFSNGIEDELRENISMIKDYICILMLKDDMIKLQLYPLYMTSMQGLDKYTNMIDNQSCIFIEWLNNKFHN